MSLINKPYTFSAGATIVAAEHNSNFDTIYNEFNGSITNANISGSAAITDSKLAQLTTAGKVSGASITLMTSLPSGAGIIPIANLASGTPTGSKFVRDDGVLAAPTVPSGSTIQTQLSKTGAVSTSTSTAIDDDTVPQTSEATVIAALSTAITASSASNTIVVTAVVNLSIDSSATKVVVSIFKDSDVSAVASARWLPNAAAAAAPVPCVIQFFENPADTSAHTYKVGVGVVSGNSVTINGEATARKLGGVLYSSLKLEEVKA